MIWTRQLISTQSQNSSKIDRYNRTRSNSTRQLNQLNVNIVLNQSIDRSRSNNNYQINQLSVLVTYMCTVQLQFLPYWVLSDVQFTYRCLQAMIWVYNQMHLCPSGMICYKAPLVVCFFCKLCLSVLQDALCSKTIPTKQKTWFSNVNTSALLASKVEEFQETESRPVQILLSDRKQLDLRFTLIVSLLLVCFR